MNHSNHSNPPVDSCIPWDYFSDHSMSSSSPLYLLPPAPLSDGSLSTSSSRSIWYTRGERRQTVIRALFAEFLATFFFILINCGISTHARQLNFAPGVASASSALGGAFSSIALIYSFSELSGGHFNPAVTIATCLRRRTSVMKSILYIIAQLVGANLAIIVLFGSFSSSDSGFFPGLSVSSFSSSHAWLKSFLLEFFSTFFFVFVVFSAAFEQLEVEKKKTMTLRGVTNSKGLTLYAANPQTKSGFAPLVIGFTLGALIGLGACFNPARLIVGAVWSGNFSHFVFYISGQVGGSIAAAGVEYGFSNFKLDFYLPGYDGNQENGEERQEENNQDSETIQLTIPVERRNQ